MIEEIEKENSELHSWKYRNAPSIAIEYWNINQNASLLDVVKAIRKDEEHHK